MSKKSLIVSNCLFLIKDQPSYPFWFLSPANLIQAMQNDPDKYLYAIYIVDGHIIKTSLSEPNFETCERKIAKFVKNESGYKIYTKTLEDEFYPMLTVTIYENDIMMTYCGQRHIGFCDDRKKKQVLADIEAAYQEYKRMSNAIDDRKAHLIDEVTPQEPLILQETVN